MLLPVEDFRKVYLFYKGIRFANFFNPCSPSHRVSIATCLIMKSQSLQDFRNNTINEKDFLKSEQSQN